MEEENKEEVENVVSEENTVSEEMENTVSESADALTDVLYANFEDLNLTFEKYKSIRDNYKLVSKEKCDKCGKKFKDDMKLYHADMIHNNTIQKVLICSKCANKISDKD